MCVCVCVSMLVLNTEHEIETDVETIEPAFTFIHVYSSYPELRSRTNDYRSRGQGPGPNMHDSVN